MEKLLNTLYMRSIVCYNIIGRIVFTVNLQMEPTIENRRVDKGEINNDFRTING